MQNYTVPAVNIGARLRELREQEELSLTKLARRAGVSRTYLYQIERGESSPTYEVILKLCQGLKCRPALLTDAIAIRKSR